MPSVTDFPLPPQLASAPYLADRDLAALASNLAYRAAWARTTDELAAINDARLRVRAIQLGRMWGIRSLDAQWLTYDDLRTLLGVWNLSAAVARTERELLVQPASDDNGLGWHDLHWSGRVATAFVVAWFVCWALGFLFGRL